jgi:hypothetical protein
MWVTIKKGDVYFKWFVVDEGIQMTGTWYNWSATKLFINEFNFKSNMCDEIISLIEQEANCDYEILHKHAE